MERGELSLDEMMSRFEEGQSLVGYCTRKLDDVEKRVELLVQKDGQTRRVPFEPAGQADGADGGAERGDLIEDPTAAGAVEEVTSRLLNSEVEEMLSVLDDRERRIVSMRFGFDGESAIADARALLKTLTGS